MYVQIVLCLHMSIYVKHQTIKKLIEELKKLPQNLPIRTDNRYPEGENEWIVDIECSRTGESGYEIEGEVRLLTSLGYKFEKYI